ncbi:protein FAR1-RELATED SEQUENCE 5-like [Salvia miltiorrhiza]|uniref:protein FAR1-RELATED SEQUENCE 5-like n=1 Tax=Salvia miltiorrhiza TaxID=226208 RepID=UPI0025AC05A9|nr:protein FAR1-RELATED SEQUENCE 5-like [Salvia miltiorrhiza]
MGDSDIIVEIQDFNVQLNEEINLNDDYSCESGNVSTDKDFSTDQDLDEDTLIQGQSSSSCDPLLGLRSQNFEDIYKAYKSYAKEVGFDIRRSSSKYLAEEAGGEHLVGHTKKDHLNHVNKIKMKAIEGGDAQTLIDSLNQHGVEDEEFFFRVKLDEEERLSNIFWRDSMMKQDFMLFGDVMVFDTTYRTNKYNLICAPFVGVNNHKRNVMFACAFISNEQTETFEWLFDVFKKSMEGRCPVTLFTDQDKAISNGIEKVFPLTRHRLCIWHLYQNAQSHLGSLKSDKTFTKMFQKCMTGCANSEEFEICWKNMISNYKLENITWFNRLYDLKEKWCNAYNKDFFSAGILSSQRSESTNSTLGFNAKKTTSLNDFYKIFKQTVDRWRSNEQTDEFRCIRGKPNSVLKIRGLLQHASEVYTFNIFRDFEIEFKESISVSFSSIYEDEQFKAYNVTNDDGMIGYTVSFSTKESFITCSCKKWTKFAKKNLWDKGAFDSVNNSNNSMWRNQIMRKSYNLVLRAQDSEECRAVIENGLNSITLDLESLMITTQAVNQMEDVAVSSACADNVLDPNRSNTKGRRKRIQGHYDVGKKSNKKSTASNSKQSKEFGTKTPNPILF